MPTRTGNGRRRALASLVAASMLLATMAGSARAAAFALLINDQDGSSWSAPAMAQTLDTVGPITSVDLLMHRRASGDTGTFRVEIRTAPSGNPSGSQAASSGIVLASKTVSTSGISTNSGSPSTVPVTFDAPAIAPAGVDTLAIVVLRGTNTGLRWHASTAGGPDQYNEGKGFLCVTGACWTGSTPSGNVDFVATIYGSTSLMGSTPRVAIVAPRGPTKATSFVWTILFDKAVTGLTAGDFIKTGGADNCSLGTPSSGNGGLTWSMTVSHCSAGTLRLTLRANSVRSTGDLVLGPSVATKSAATLRIDRSKPKGSAPRATPRLDENLSGTSIQLNVAWDAASDTGGAGIWKYEVARSSNGGDTWVALGSVQPTLAKILQPSGGTAIFRVRPVDWAGNKGAWVKGPTLRPRIAQQTSPNATFSSGWTTLNDVAYSGGSAKVSDAAGSSARYRFTGRAIGLVMTTDPTLGVVKVYIDGDLRKIVDMADFDPADQIVVYARRFSTSSEHVIRIVSSSGARPNVILDAFVRL